MELSRTAGRQRRFSAAAATVLLLGLTACSGEREGQDYSVPDSLCGAKINAALLSSFLPPGKELTTQGSTPAINVTKCRVYIDGKPVAQTSQEWWDNMNILEFSRGLTLDDPTRQTGDGLYAYSDQQAFGKASRCNNRDHKNQVLYTAIQISGSKHRNADSMQKLISEYTIALEQSSVC
ncbi:hypothetical protein [Streptomyces sp. CL12-4]|uniref:hypothetical protein n=1 Tax=Streptomyces sp. CL12-4 TaxID=2810306 RepID=UPI001EFB3E18|nr:hypothetical protein [Streptomyces sp. CL12-4]MCG8964747.1 hypothetical protein [Streptomyces sp. CL12-4]